MTISRPPQLVLAGPPPRCAGRGRLPPAARAPRRLGASPSSATRTAPGCSLRSSRSSARSAAPWAPGGLHSPRQAARLCPKQAAARPRRRLDGELVHAREARRRGQDRALLAGDHAPGPHVDGGGDVRRARRGALADARGAARRGRATHALPLWPVFVLCGIAAVLALVGSLRTRSAPPADRAGPRGVAALRALAARSAASCSGHSACACRLGATVAVVLALGLPHPVLAALLILPALDVAGRSR